MTLKCVVSLFLLLMLTGCSALPKKTAPKVAQGKTSQPRSLNMAQLCKDSAARRYNTEAPHIDITEFERFQGSYEMRGQTARKEGFVCSFDTDGQFLHLSMR